MKSNELMKSEYKLNDKELSEALREACAYYLADWELEMFLVKVAEKKINLWVCTKIKNKMKNKKSNHKNGKGGIN